MIQVIAIRAWKICKSEISTRTGKLSLLLAGTASSVGKTTAAIGLSAALRARGLKVQPAKAGPDFLDAAWLAQVCERACPSLDAWMAAHQADLPKLLSCFAESGDFILIEGAMGLFDGDERGETSSASLACLFNLPILLVINAKGLGQSVAAMAEGFLNYRPAALSARGRFCGIICAHVSSQRHARILREAILPVCQRHGTPFLGCLPCAGAPQIPSRHLGLVQASEQTVDFAAAGAWFDANISLNALLNLQAPPLPARTEFAPLADDAPVIAIAHDRAFAFLYPDLPLLLRQLGAKTILFSPLADPCPPPCDGLYFPGGYPELFARELADNAKMMVAIRQLARAGLPIYGECGGYLYLSQSLTDLEGTTWPMLGLLPVAAAMGQNLAALGYRRAYADWLGHEFVLGHEFHYARETRHKAVTLWRCHNARGENLGFSGAKLGNIAGSWLHLYPLGSQAFWRSWLKLVKRQKEQRKAKWATRLEG